MTPERTSAGRKAVAALIEMLPPPGAVFPIEERKRWLGAMGATLVLIYGGDREIRTQIEDDSVRIRSPKKVSQTGTAYDMPGATADMTLPRERLGELIQALVDLQNEQVSS